MAPPEGEKNGRTTGFWKMVAGMSLAANLSLLGTGIAWVVAENGHVTRKELNTAIEAYIDYPYLSDRALVMAHLADSERHESDRLKRQRIREEITRTVDQRLARIESDLKDIKLRLDASGRP